MIVEIVKDQKTKKVDIDMTNRIRYNAASEGLIFIAVHNYVRICPPLIISREQIDDVVNRLGRAVKKAIEGHPKEVTSFSHHSLKFESTGRKGR